MYNFIVCIVISLSYRVCSFEKVLSSDQNIKCLEWLQFFSIRLQNLYFVVSWSIYISTLVLFLILFLGVHQIVFPSPKYNLFFFITLSTSLYTNTLVSSIEFYFCIALNKHRFLFRSYIPNALQFFRQRKNKQKNYSKRLTLFIMQ